MKRERGALSRASRALRLAPFVYLLLIQPGRRPEGSGEKNLGLLTERERGVEQSLNIFRAGGGERAQVAVGSNSVNSEIGVEYISSFPVLPAWPLAPLPERLHDFGAPTAFSTLDGRHHATCYGNDLLAWASPAFFLMAYVSSWWEEEGKSWFCASQTSTLASLSVNQLER